MRAPPTYRHYDPWCSRGARFREKTFFQNSQRNEIAKREVTLPDTGCSGDTSISLFARIVIVLYCLLVSLCS